MFEIRRVAADGLRAVGGGLETTAGDGCRMCGM